MNGYIKYFENGGKNMSLLIKDDDVLNKYNEIWGNIKEKLNIKFHSMSVYDEKYMKDKVREFNGMIKANFSDDKIPKENMHYTYIACITIDSVMKMEKKNYPQVIQSNANTERKRQRCLNSQKLNQNQSQSQNQNLTPELESKFELESDTK